MSELPAYPEAAAKREEAEGPPRPSGDYASWGRRALALILDNVLLLVPAGIFFALVFVSSDVVAGISGFLAFFFWLVFPFFYFTFMHGRFGGGQTLGKRALGIGVRHAETGGIVGYGAAFGRYGMVWVFSIFALPLILDYLFPLWDRQNQTLHDKVATSVVLRV